MINLLPYIPFYDYRKIWVEKKLNLIKENRKNQLIDDAYGEKMSWSVVEYYLFLLYDEKYFDESPGPGLRMSISNLNQYF